MPEFQSKQPESVLLKAVESTFTQIIRDNFIDIFLVAPTLPVTVFLRRKLGFRVVKPWVIYLAFLYFNTWAFVPALVTGLAATRQSPYGAQPAPPPEAREGLLFWLLELLFLVLAVYWRIHAWKLIKEEKLWHTRSRGISFLSIIPIRESLVQRFIDPGVCFLVGIFVYRLSYAFLGIWFIVSAFALLLLEQIVWDQQLNAMLDQYDGFIDAQVASENSATFAAGNKDAKPPSIEDALGRSVVFAPELRNIIEKRRAMAESPVEA